MGRRDRLHRLVLCLGSKVHGTLARCPLVSRADPPPPPLRFTSPHVSVPQTVGPQVRTTVVTRVVIEAGPAVEPPAATPAITPVGTRVPTLEVDSHITLQAP